MKPLLLILAPVAWESIRQRPQQLALQLAAKYEVLYIDPPADWLVVAKYRSWMGQVPGRIFEAARGIKVLQLAPSLPYYGQWDFLCKLNCKYQAWQINRALRAIGKMPDALMVTLPMHRNIVDLVKAKKIVYDCMDFYAGFKIKRTSPRLMSRLESALCKRADLVIATSSVLRDHLAQWRTSHIEVVRNAVDERLLQADASIHPYLIDLPRPIVGYIGSVAKWLDLEAIATAARALPNTSFVFVGPISVEVGPLTGIPNLHFYGECAYSDVPRFLVGFDVCAIPFAINPLTRAVNPVKVYEYFSYGKPVVSSRLPEVEHFAQDVYFYETPDQLTTQIRNALSESTARGAQRRTIAAANTWNARAQQVMEHLGDGNCG